MALRLETTTRLATATAAVSVLALLVGCGTRAPGALAPAARPATVAAPRAPVPAAPAPAAPPRAGAIRVELESRPAAEGPRPRLEILSPTFGEVLPELAIRKQEVSVQVTPALGAGLTLAVSLDGMRPRPIEAAAPLVLGDLIAEDRKLVAGVHSLLLVVLDATGAEVFGGASRSDQVFALVDFYVGGRDRALPPPDAPRLFCLGPAGTYHGAATERPLLDLFAVGAVGPEIPLELEAGTLAFEGSVDPRRRYRLTGLPAGDVRVVAGAKSGPRAECVFTLNPEGMGGT